MEQLLKEAYRLRFEYYNGFDNKQEKWHTKYKKHELYDTVVKSFEYDFKQIGLEMPKLIEEYSLKNNSL